MGRVFHWANALSRHAQHRIRRSWHRQHQHASVAAQREVERHLPASKAQQRLNARKEPHGTTGEKDCRWSSRCDRRCRRGKLPLRPPGGGRSRRSRTSSIVSPHPPPTSLLPGFTITGGKDKFAFCPHLFPQQAPPALPYPALPCPPFHPGLVPHPSS